jgi:YihY family inner membrane protein
MLRLNRRKIHQIRFVLTLSVQKFLQIDGVMWSGAFAYHAFFSLFPLIIFFITVASLFIDKTVATTEIIGYVEKYVPLSGEMHHHIFETIAEVVTARRATGATAFLILAVMAVQCFITLINATSRAWGTRVHNWWRLPMKSLILFVALATAVFLGIALPLLAAMVKDWFFADYHFHSRVIGIISVIIPLITVFFSLNVIYEFAPRRSTRFAEVWIGALCATVLLWIAEFIFVKYLNTISVINTVYGTFSGIMALLLWIYLSGGIFIFGACLCAAQAEKAPSRNTRL